MKLKSLKYSLIFVALVIATAYALPTPDKNDLPLASSGQQIIQQDQWIDANNVLMFVSNVGSFSYDRTAVFGKNDGFYYPYSGIDNIINGTSNQTVCFAAGLWFGGVDSATGDTLISASEYGSDYWPGPMSGGTFIPDADIDSLYRVYKIYSDSMSSNPNQDYLDWPSSMGAPVDNLGNPLLTGKQTLWSVYNDANSAVHLNDASSSIGLGIEVQHTVWADKYVEISTEDFSIYSKYILINKSSNTYNDFFISLWFDPDIGNAGDDLAGCDTLNDIFFCYNDGSDSDYGSAPPVFGGKLISGPPMYSFMHYFNASPVNYRWTYQYMNGLVAWQGGTPLANGTRYASPGDPVTGIGDVDNYSSDKRMMASFGPLTFAPGDTEQIIIKLGVGQGEDPLSSITSLKEVLNFNPPSFEDTCCIGIRGDIDGNGNDNSFFDLVYLIDYIFRGGPAPPCPIEADLNFDGRSATALDLVYIIDDIFRGAPSPGPCY